MKVDKQNEEDEVTFKIYEGEEKIKEEQSNQNDDST
jgi:hypothetical protein